MKPFAGAWRDPVRFWHWPQNGFGRSLEAHAETRRACARRNSIWRREIFGDHHSCFAVLLERYKVPSQSVSLRYKEIANEAAE